MNKIKFTVLFFMFNIILGTFLYCTFKKQAPTKFSKTQDGEPFNGGKQTPPVDIQSNLNGLVQSNADLDLNLEIVIPDDYRELHTKIRGIDGVQVSGTLEKTHGRKVINQNPIHNIHARLGQGVSGYVAIDVSYQTADSSYSVTRLIPLNTSGANMRKSTQEPEIDADGEPIVHLTPEVR